MVNFRIYPGLFVRVLNDAPGVEKGRVYQVLHARYAIALVGVNGQYDVGDLSLEPVYPQRVLDQIAADKETRAKKSWWIF